jgi:hypothetical protein
MDRRILLGVAGIAGMAALSRLAKAGPLNPPPGPISSTGKTLQEIHDQASSAARKTARTDSGFAEPRIPITACPPSPEAQFVITQPGAYYLPSNLIQEQGRVCIDIQCSDVDIDGQGFAFHGSGNAASPPSSCIRSSGQSNIELYDCAFHAWRGCCVDCDDCDDVFVSDCIFRQCSCPPGIAADGTIIPGAMVRCRDRCGHEDVQFSECVGRAIQARHGSYCSELVVTDCTGDAVVMGNDGEVDDCLFRNVAGGGVRCGNGACVDSCAVLNGNVVIGSVADSHIRCGDASCVSDCEVRNSVGTAFALGSNCVADSCDVTGGSGGAFRCADGCCLDGCTVLSHTSSNAIITNMRTRINELEARLCSGGLLLSVGADSTVECCEITGGSGGAIHCDDGCCVEDCSIVNHAGVAIACASRCTIDSNKVVASWGVECAAECCVSDNEVSYDGSGGGGGGGGLNIYGERCCVSGNYVAGVIYLFGGADRCLVEDNHVVGAGGSAGTGGGSISIAAGVTGCSLRSNHARRGSMTSAFVVPPGNSFGPIVNTIAGGDLSALPGGAHPHANFVS